MGHSHRASSLRQSNKGHKSSKTSKRSIKGSSGGKINRNKNISSGKGKGGGHPSKNKANRINIAKQRREASKQKLLDAQRHCGGQQSFNDGTFGNNSNNSSAPLPKLVGIISLSDSEKDFEGTVVKYLADGADKTILTSSSSSTVFFANHKKEGYLSLLSNTTAFRSHYVQHNVDPKDEHQEEDASIQAALDLCRVCDLIIFLIDGRFADRKKDILSGMAVIAEDKKAMSSSTSIKSSVAPQQDYDHLISDRGDRVLSSVKAQGLPTAITLLVNNSDSNETGTIDDSASVFSLASSMKSSRRAALKKRLELKKYVSRFALTEFGENPKVMELNIHSSIDDTEHELCNNEDDTMDVDVISSKNDKMYLTRAALIRTMCTMKSSPAKWVSKMPRPYIVSEGNIGHVYNESTRELKITGYIRGQAPWDVNKLVHIPNIGTFGMKLVENATAAVRPTTTVGSSGSRTTTTNVIEKRELVQQHSDSTILATCDTQKREPLQKFANPDALEGEQNLIGFEEEENEHFFDADDDNDVKNCVLPADTASEKSFARPAGWNDYQSAWLDAIDENKIKGDDSIANMEDAQDNGELALSLNKKKGMNEDDTTDEFMDHVDERERQSLIEERKKDQKDENSFPDEVEVQENELARDRFQRYRSLTSFRNSYWDPKENLPSTYGSIFHFNSFKATEGDVMAEINHLMASSNKSVSGHNKEEGDTGNETMQSEEESKEDVDSLIGYVPSGILVTITVEGVSAVAYSRVSPSSLISAVCLLPHENKISVLHMALSQTINCDKILPSEDPIKSKDVLTFRCGWRTWKSRPIFSQNNLNSDKHKFERYLPTCGAFFAASLFGPVTYTPCPVLVFRQNTSKLQLISLGSVLGADADRITIKRIVLTGYPSRVHKRHATVKYMFNNPEDVKVS